MPSDVHPDASRLVYTFGSLNSSLSLLFPAHASSNVRLVGDNFDMGLPVNPAAALVAVIASIMLFMFWGRTVLSAAATVTPLMLVVGVYRIRLLALCPTHVALVRITVVFFVRYLLSIAGWVLLLCVSYWGAVILSPLLVLSFVLVLIVVGFLLSKPQPFCKRLDLSFVDEP